MKNSVQRQEKQGRLATDVTIGRRIVVSYNYRQTRETYWALRGAPPKWRTISPQ